MGLAPALGTPATAASPTPSLVGQVVRFASVGVASTALHLGLFALLHTVLTSQPANAVALVVATVANTAVNRRWTFAVSGRRHLTRHHLQALAVFVITWAASAGALQLLALAVTEPSTTLSTAVLGVSMAASTAVRFVALRGWIFRQG
jgi:putative flippase GtrA